MDKNTYDKTAPTVEGVLEVIGTKELEEAVAKELEIKDPPINRGRVGGSTRDDSE